MGVESCNIPDNDYLDQEFNLPEELKHDISWESRSEILDCWLDTLIEVPSDIIKFKIIEEIKAASLLGLHESNFSLGSIDITDPEFNLSGTIRKVMDSLSPKEKFLLSVVPLQVLFVGGISFNYSRYIETGKLTKVEYFQGIYDSFHDVSYNYFENITEDEKMYLENELGTADISNLSFYQAIFERLGIVVPIENSLRPITRPQIIERISEYRAAVESEKNINQYDILNVNGFQGETLSFIENDFILGVMGDDFNISSIHVDRLKDFMLFLIDMETTGGTDLVNGESTATSYTQTLNELQGNRSIGKFNSIDTRMRNALKFYNNGEITPGSRDEIFNLPDGLDLQWLGNLWKYNESGRNMNEFTFDSEIRLTLIHLFTEDPVSMRNIINGIDSKQAAINLYDAHHTNSTGHSGTNNRLNEYVNKEEHYG